MKAVSTPITERSTDANEEAIRAWDGPLYDRFVRFRLWFRSAAATAAAAALLGGGPLAPVSPPNIDDGEHNQHNHARSTYNHRCAKHKNV